VQFLINFATLVEKIINNRIRKQKK